MSADRYEIFDEGSQIRILYSGSISTIISGPLGTHIEDAVIGAIRQQARDIAELRAECDLLTHKVICCGVAARHSDPLLTTTGAYAGKWNSPQADCVRKLRAERDQLRAELAAAVARAEKADARIAELERECQQWRLELRIYRETENKRIAELEQAVTVRDTEIARLETDLELARIGARRYETARMMDPRMWADACKLNLFTGKHFDEIIDELRPFMFPQEARAGNGAGGG